MSSVAGPSFTDSLSCAIPSSHVSRADFGLHCSRKTRLEELYADVRESVDDGRPSPPFFSGNRHQAMCLSDILPRHVFNIASTSLSNSPTREVRTSCFGEEIRKKAQVDTERRNQESFQWRRTFHSCVR